MNYSLITRNSTLVPNAGHQPAIEVIDRYGVPEWVCIPRNNRAWRPSNIQQLKEFVRVPTDKDLPREH